MMSGDLIRRYTSLHLINRFLLTRIDRDIYSLISKTKLDFLLVENEK